MLILFVHAEIRLTVSYLSEIFIIEPNLLVIIYWYKFTLIINKLENQNLFKISEKASNLYAFAYLILIKLSNLITLDQQFFIYCQIYTYIV